MKVTEAGLPGILILEPKFIGDERGFFMETWQRERYAGCGLPAEFVQDNVSLSRKGVLRGLHFQNPFRQGKLLFVLRGEVFDVAVDARLGSPTFGQWFGLTLSAADRRQLYIPPGFAHGFCVISDEALFAYKCTERYDASSEQGILWSDPAIGITWPCANPALSERDKAHPRLSEIDERRLPVYGEC